MEPPKKRYKLVPIGNCQVMERLIIARKPPKKRKIYELKNLNDQCIESILKWLSLDDLYAMSRTCKRIQKLAGLQFQRIYPNSSISIELSAENTIDSQYEEKYDLYFSANVRRVTMTSYKYDQNPMPLFNYLKLNFSKNLQELRLDRINCGRLLLGKTIKEQLKNLQTIAFNRCSVDNIHQQFLKHCPNLEHLQIKEKGHYARCGDEWKYVAYPNLKTLTYWGWNEKPCTNLHIFFKINRNVKNISCMSVKTIETILQNVIELENLVVYCETPEEFQEIATLLLLHSTKFRFKRFELVFLFNGDFEKVPENFDYIQNLSALPSFQGFHCLFPMNTILVDDILNRMSNLRTLSLKLALENEDLAWYLAQHLPLLECVRIYITYSLKCFGLTFKPLTMPFLAQLTKLTDVIVQFSNCSDVMHRNDIVELNSNRLRLNQAGSTTIYMSRDIINATKFILPVGGLVKLKPISQLKCNIYTDPFLF